MSTVHLHPRVLELLASRICHDLVSPVGAISNGMELMEELGDEGRDEAVKLISNSTAEASVRLKCFRLAYGAAGSDRNIGFDEVREVFVEWMKASRLKLEWQKLQMVGGNDTIPKGFAKTLLNILILAEECGHGDGLLKVEAMTEEAGIKVTVTGKNPSFREKAESAFTEKISVDELDPRLVHAYITGQFAKHFGLTIRHATYAEPLSLVFELLPTR